MQLLMQCCINLHEPWLGLVRGPLGLMVAGPPVLVGPVVVVEVVMRRPVRGALGLMVVGEGHPHNAFWAWVEAGGPQEDVSSDTTNINEAINTRVKVWISLTYSYLTCTPMMPFEGGLFSKA